MAGPEEKKQEQEQEKAPPFTVYNDPEVMNASSPSEAAKIGQKRMQEYFDEVNKTVEEEEEEKKKKKSEKEIQEQNQRIEKNDADWKANREEQMENDPVFAEQERNRELNLDADIEEYNKQIKQNSSQLENGYKNLFTKTAHNDIAKVVSIGKIANERLSKHWPVFRYLNPSFYAERRLVEIVKKDLSVFTADPKDVDELLKPIDMSGSNGKQQFIDQVKSAFDAAQNRQQLLATEDTPEQKQNNDIFDLMEKKEDARMNGDKEFYDKLEAEINNQKMEQYKEADKEGESMEFELDGLDK